MVASELEDWLRHASVAPEVWRLHPGYRVLLLAARGLQPGPSDPISERHLAAAERTAVSLLGCRAPEQLPEVAAWRAAYRSFGAKPQRTRPSVEALLRRLATGLPRVDRLTDTYNAVSISYLLPVGGEDLARYHGSPRLVRASGAETFDTTGPLAPECPDPGEVVWRDDAGVTCRRWNWRQCARTRMTPATTTAVFILDWPPAGGAQPALEDAGAALTRELRELSPDVHVRSRLVQALPSPRAES